MSDERMSDEQFRDRFYDMTGCPDALYDEAVRARSAELALIEQSRLIAKEVAAIDSALDEFASHHKREGGWHTVAQCVREAMDTLRIRIASLEAEKMALGVEVEMVIQQRDTECEGNILLCEKLNVADRKVDTLCQEIVHLRKRVEELEMRMKTMKPRTEPY